MDKIEYREALTADLDELVDLWWIMQHSHDAYDIHFYENMGQATCKNLSRRYFSDLLKKKTCFIHVAVASDKIVGLIVGHLQTRPPIYLVKQIVEIEVTIVHPDYRKMGIFRHLLKCIEQKAADAGVRMISLTVDHENPAKYAYTATGFYKRQHKMIKRI